MGLSETTWLGKKCEAIEKRKQLCFVGKRGVRLRTPLRASCILRILSGRGGVSHSNPVFFCLLTPGTNMGRGREGKGLPPRYARVRMTGACKVGALKRDNYYLG